MAAHLLFTRTPISYISPSPNRLSKPFSLLLNLNPSSLSLHKSQTSSKNPIPYTYFLYPPKKRFKFCKVLESEPPFPTEEGVLRKSKAFQQWDSLTSKFAAAANLPFLLLQLPQIVLNYRNLLAGNTDALLAVPWLGMLTGLLGNLTLLSYFAKKREAEAIIVQTLGVVSIYIVISQLAMAQAMPLPHFVITSVVVGLGLVLNFLNYFNWLNPGIWRFWEDFVTVAGLSVLPQVMWSTFVPYIPNSILPGLIAFASSLLAVVLARMGTLPEKGVKFISSISGWTATLLFMWMPVSQMWTNFLNPDNIKGLSAFSMLLAMIGNGLLIPRALFIRDLMWFTGAGWASLLYGLGNLTCMYCFKSITANFYLAAAVGLFTWLERVPTKEKLWEYLNCNFIIALHISLEEGAEYYQSHI